jgi:hypothetical protein
MELIVLAAICALVGLGCLGAAGWAIFYRGDTGVEEIFLLLVWLSLALIFLGMAAWIARQGPLRPRAAANPGSHDKKPEGSPAPQQKTAGEGPQKTS